MRGGNERSFELGRRQEDAAIEHFTEVAGVKFCVGSLGAGVIGNWVRHKEYGGKQPGGVTALF